MRAYLSLRDRPLRQLSRAINHPGDARCDRYYRVVVAATFRQAEQFSILGHPPDSLHDSWCRIGYTTSHPRIPVAHSGWGWGER